MNFMSWLNLSVGIIQAVIQLVKLVEGPGHGLTKKELVTGLTLSAVNNALTNTGNVPLSPDSVITFIGATIDGAVKALNDSGEFKHVTQVTVDPK